MGAIINSEKIAEGNFTGDYVIYWDNVRSSDHSHAKPGIDIGPSNERRWYRIYASGWCEQGGYDESKSGLITVSFTVPFSRSPMVFLCPVTEGGGSSATIKVNGASAITLETFDMAKTNTGEFWIAYGTV